MAGFRVFEGNMTVQVKLAEPSRHGLLFGSTGGHLERQGRRSMGGTDSFIGKDEIQKMA